MNTRFPVIAAITSFGLAAGAFPSFAMAQYDAPSTYYASATGTGETLKTNLRAIISSMTGVNYGNARYSAPYTDADPNASGNILLIYNRASISPTWDGGGSWNREHIWPVSRLGVGDPSNSTTGVASDQFNLRPSNPSINSSRGNTPFGTDSSTGSYGHQGGLYYPGDADAGDVARAQFYMATRYTSLSLVDSSSPSGTQMGDLSALLRFHYKDTPDTFERRRNHAIYGAAGENSPAISNPYRQGNRNPYVDRPELVWAVFGDGANNSRLYVGPTNPSDGTSSSTVDLGRVMRNGANPAAKSVTLQKAGSDPTYFEVTTTGNATSSLSGRYNAFTYDPQSRAMQVGLNAGTATTGLKTGAVTVNNLDITTQGAGTGSADGNDTITAQYAVLDKRQVQATQASFGRVLVGATVSATASLSTTGSDNERTRVNVGASSSTDANGIRVASGSGTLFDAATDTGTRSVAGQFTSPGAKSGSLQLGVTSAENGGAGLGEGAYGNVAVAYNATVLSHATPSFFTSVATNTLTLDFGTLVKDQANGALGFSIANLIGAAGFTSALELDSIQGAGDTGAFSFDLATFNGPSALAAGNALDFDALLDTTAIGSFAANYQLSFSDENLPGARSNELMTLRLQGNVVVPEPHLLGLAGIVALMAGHRRRRRT